MSGTFLNPDGENSFIEICRKSSFVDKTNFIGEMIERLDGGEEKLVAFLDLAGLVKLLPHRC